MITASRWSVTITATLSRRASAWRARRCKWSSCGGLVSGDLAESGDGFGDFCPIVGRVAHNSVRRMECGVVDGVAIIVLFLIHDGAVAGREGNAECIGYFVLFGIVSLIVVILMDDGVGCIE